MPYAQPTGPMTGLDIWRMKFYPLNTDGTIKIPASITPATTPYEGIELANPKTFQPNLGSPRTIPVVSQGRVQTTFMLPSIDAKTAEAHLAYIDMETFAELSRVKTRTIGGATGLVVGSEKQGLEITGALLVSQLQAHDEDGLDVWNNYLLPRVKIAVTWPAFNENPIDVTLTMSLSAAKKHLWGIPLSEVNDGAKEMLMWPFVTWGAPNIVAWATDGAEDEFLLPTDAQANDTFLDTFVVYDSTAGAVVAGTPATDKFIATAIPADEKVLLGWYEQEV